MAVGTSTTPRRELTPDAHALPHSPVQAAASLGKDETSFDVTQFRRLAGTHRRETQQKQRDYIVILLTTVIALLIGSLFGNGISAGITESILVLYPLLIVGCCSQQNLYSRIPSHDEIEDAYLIIKATAIASVILVGIYFLYATPMLPRRWLFSLATVNTAMLIASRSAWRRYNAYRVKQGKAGTHVLILGAGSVGCSIAAYLENNRHLGFVFKGFVDPDPTLHPKVLGRLRDLPKIARQEFADELIITLPPKSSLAKEAILKAREMCLDVTVVPEVFDELGIQSPLEYLGNIPVMEMHREPIPAFGLFFKRAMDVLLCGIALIVIAPFMGLLALMIYLDSHGPIFYTSERVGKKGRIFRFYKFRSMIVDADAQRKELLACNERDDILFKMQNDPRVTGFGRFLRKYSLDELPQIWNVLKGEMSLVGPRPALVSEYLSYRPEHRRRLDVVPGITGLWQVSGRQDPSFEFYVSQDLKYIENWTPFLDIKILFKTIPAVLRGTGN
jgi:exopolysaccharide biosynthesis polyprenyl glycosylphosphotransferase